jgi:hypothetical protein
MYPRSAENPSTALLHAFEKGPFFQAAQGSRGAKIELEITELYVE